MANDLHGPGVCAIHETEIKLIHEVRTDVKWVLYIGAFIGTLLTMLIPIMVGFFVYLSKMDTRLAVVENEVRKVIEQKR